MDRKKLWNRRTFLQRMGYFSALGAIDPGMVWGLSDKQKPVQIWPSSKEDIGPQFAYVGTWKDGIHVFAIGRGGWRLQQIVPSNKPSALDFHPNRKFLYAANAIDTYQGLPAGTVEAYSIDTSDGRLRLLNRQPLSLSATSPGHLAVSPDGCNLVVAVRGGGSYNVLPICTDGSLGKISGIMKEVGSGPDKEHQDAAHPQMLRFDPTGNRLLSVDLGSDKLNVFALSEDRLIVADRTQTFPGSGPRSLAIHPSGQWIYVLNGLSPALSCFGYDAASGRILKQLHHIPLQAERYEASAMAMHSSGNFLYTAHARSNVGNSGSSNIAAWRIDAASGELKLIHESDRWTGASYVESLIPAQKCLFVLSREEGVSRMDIDPGSGMLLHTVRVASVPRPLSAALRYL